MDMFHLDMPANSFDCVLEKATFEVLFVNEKDPWNVSNEADQQFNLLMQQVSFALHWVNLVT